MFSAKAFISTFAVAVATTSAHAATYMPVGPQTNVAVSTVTSGGWSQCYVAPMSTFIGDNAENVLSVCAGDYLMMAGRATGSDTLLLLAQTTFADAILNTGISTSNSHTSNGSEWYFSPNWSWGFTAAGNVVTLLSCDIQSGDDRMCLHTSNAPGGYRIGDITGLNDSNAYEKVFYVAAANPVPEPETYAMMLAGLGAMGFMARRRRTAD